MSLNFKERFIKWVIKKTYTKRNIEYDLDRKAVKKMMNKDVSLPDDKYIQLEEIVIYELIPKEQIINFRNKYIRFINKFSLFPDPRMMDIIIDFFDIHRKYVNLDSFNCFISAKQLTY